MPRTYYYTNVKGLGNVAVSRHAQDQADLHEISQELFDRVLLMPNKPDVLEGTEIIWREREGVRIVILTNPRPFRGAKLVKTVFRVQGQAQARTTYR
jgi:hypothetical protein